MHLKTKQLALSGILMALSVICIVLGGIIEINTLFFLLVAAFLGGIVIYEMGLRMGALFIAGTFFLGFFLGSQKMYAFTYLAFAVYILLAEAGYRQSRRIPNPKMAQTVLWVYKFFVFNLIFLPCLIVMPEVFVGPAVKSWVLFLLAVVGQGVFVLLDLAYNTFIIHLWKHYRRHFFKDEF